MAHIKKVRTDSFDKVYSAPAEVDAALRDVGDQELLGLLEQMRSLEDPTIKAQVERVWAEIPGSRDQFMNSIGHNLPALQAELTRRGIVFEPVNLLS